MPSCVEPTSPKPKSCGTVPAYSCAACCRPSRVACMLAQRVRDLVAGHHADFVVVQMQLVDQPAVDHDLAARQAIHADLVRLDDVDLPLPFFERSFHFSANGISRLTMSRARLTSALSSPSRASRSLGFAQDLRIFLRRLRFERRRRNQVAKERRIAEADLIVRRGIGRRRSLGVRGIGAAKQGRTRASARKRRKRQKGGAERDMHRHR